VLHLLENSDREDITALMRSADVMRLVEEIRAGKDQHRQRRLQKILQRYSVPRSGAPIKNVGQLSDAETAQAVDDLEARIEAAYTFVQRQKQRDDSAAFAENIEAALVTDFKMPPKWAALMAENRTRRAAAYQIVALSQGRTVDAVKMAASRGRNNRTSV